MIENIRGRFEEVLRSYGRESFEAGKRGQGYGTPLLQTASFLECLRAFDEGLAHERRESPPLPSRVRPAVRATDPITSGEAWEQMKGKSAGIRSAIVGLLSVLPEGLVATEIADELGFPRDTISPRMTELETAGLVFRSPGEKRRPSPAHGRQQVWIHTRFLPAKEESGGKE